MLGQTTVASDGTFSDTVTIPADTRPGKHVLQLRGLSMKNGTPFVVVVLITVTPAGAPSHDLAFTGANISAGVLILIVLMAMGIGALAVTRRRSRSRGINR